MSLYVVDVEADGPVPGLYSMVSFAAMKVQDDVKNAPSFRANTAPITDKWIPEALAVSKVTREQHLRFPENKIAMIDFVEFIKKTNIGKPIFMSDNPCFDWQWINYYFTLNEIQNPFGFSGRRIGDFYAGLERNWFVGGKWRKFRKTAHTHDPLDDVRGNVEAFVAFCQKHKIRYSS